MKTAYAVLLLGVFGWLYAAAEDASPSAPPPPRCEVAVVNPVSGFAECVKPRGAKADPPPPRPPPTPQECRDHRELNSEECRALEGGRDRDGKSSP
ncbi:MAG TPA: hypothetical protein VHV81_05645 [Steroidobacteraceae bacterium]|jgi:hypothetical protein|nr:hypothetical protein [Steroidobacteraceae bacterium]